MRKRGRENERERERERENTRSAHKNKAAHGVRIVEARAAGLWRGHHVVLIVAAAHAEPATRVRVCVCV
jgi:hypothetical protein